MELDKIDAALDGEDGLPDFWRTLKQRPGFHLETADLDGLSDDSLKTAVRLLKGLEENSADYRKNCRPFMPSYQLMRTYLEETLSREENGIKAFDIDTRWAHLGEELAGLVYQSSIGRHVVIVNSEIEGYEKDALAHQELRRILANPPRQRLLLIGLDALNHLENDIDEFVEAVFSIHF
ncbi:MAG: hypothetical protein HPY50_14970 [Firmicutes bacterium]|nr:hypothetical protein [Bacillota bacterium]